MGKFSTDNKYIVGRINLLGDSEEDVAEFLEGMLKELILMVSLCVMSEEKRARIYKRIAQFESFLAQLPSRKWPQAED